MEDRDKEQELRKKHALWARFNAPARHKQAMLDKLAWPDQDLVDRVLASAVGGGLVGLIGPRGTGKTQLATWLGHNAVHALGWSPRYYRLMDLFDLAKRGFGESKTEMESIHAAVGYTELLVLDEVQDRNQSAWEDTLLTRLLDDRYGRKQATILIGNLKPTEFTKSVGTSIASRMQEVGMVAEIVWKSFRVK